MKIAIIGPAYPYRGGIANFSERLAHEFSLHKDDVCLYTFSMMYPHFLFPGKTQYAETALTYNLKIDRLINSINPFNWWQVARKIAKQNYDIIFVAYSIPFMSPCLSTISRTIRKNCNSKIISITHNLIPHERRIGDNWLSTYFVNSCHAHLTLSEKVKNDIIQIQPKAKVVVANHPIYDTFGEAVEKNSAINKLKLDINKKYILFFGLIRAYKGLDLLLDAMPTIIKYDNTIQLIVAGEFYDDEQVYLNKIKNNNIENNVIIHNYFIPEDTVNLYFGASDIVVQPYKNGTQSGVTQVSYHFNKPMIVTNVGGLPEHVPHNVVGYVCEPNAVSIAQSVIDFYSENKERVFIENIKIEKNKYSWHNLVTIIKEILYD